MAEVYYQIYSSLRDKSPTLLFYLSRETDDNIVVYRAKRKDNELINDYVDITATKLSDTTNTHKILPKNLISNYLGLNVEKKDNIYTATLKRFVVRKLTLRLKKIQGRVTSTCNIETTWNQKYDIIVENAEFYHAHLHFTEKLGSMSFDKIEVHARASQLEMTNALKKIGVLNPQFNCGPNEMIFIREEIKVTPDMMKDVSIADLWEMYTKM